MTGQAPGTGSDRMVDGDAVAQAFAGLAAALVGPYVVSDLAQRLVDGCVELLDVWAAGLLIADPGSTPKLLAASTHQAQVLELVQVASGQGPCLAAMSTGELVHVEDLEQVEEQWPAWTAGARAIGVQRAYGIPLHVGDRTIGALNLFRRLDAPLATTDLDLARALADLATVGIVHQRALGEAESVTSQLRHALDSRVVIEQAKGRLAERLGVGVEEAFALLRQHARSTSTALSEVARAVVEDGALPGAPSD